MTFLATAGLMTAASTAQATPDHYFKVINNSSNTIHVTGIVSRCVYTTNYTQNVPPGQTMQFNWEDSNSIYMSCTDLDKFVAFTIQMDGHPNAWPGYLGITHRQLSGSTWYNGQFYASSVSVTSNNSLTGSPYPISYTDGSAPPNWIQALCSHNNYCFGPFSMMEMDSKSNGDTWQRSYTTESGWAFQINDPN